MNSKVVFIRPKYQESPQKRNTFTMVNGQRMGLTKAPKAKFWFQIQDGKNGKLNINLGELIKNPWRGKPNGELAPAWQSSDITNKEMITKQEYLEIKYSLDPGYLNYDSYRIFNYVTIPGQHRKQSRTYLQSFQRVLNDGVTKIVLDNLDDEILYEAMLASSMFAKSYAESESNSRCRFYISYIEDEKEESITINRLKITSMSNLNTLITSMPNYLIKMAIVLNVSRGRITEEAAQRVLFDFLDTDKKHFIGSKTYSSQAEKINLFNEYFSMITSKDKRLKEKFEAMYDLRNALHANVISDERDKYIWNEKRGTNLEIIGKSYEEAIEFFVNPDNTAYVEQIKFETNSRLK